MDLKENKNYKMSKGKAKSRFNFDKDKKGNEIGCEYEDGSWCNLPKYKRCEHCIRCVDGSKACQVTAF
jgi:hypothetical protein